MFRCRLALFVGREGQGEPGKTTYQAGIPGLNLDSIFELGLPLCVISYGSDLAGENVRVKAEFEAKIREHNRGIVEAGCFCGFVCIVDIICFGSERPH